MVDDVHKNVREFPFQSNCESYSVKLTRGLYFIELWGARGGYCSETDHKGRGAYTSGYLFLNQKRDFLIFIGGKGQDCSPGKTNTIGGCNGGGSGGKSYRTYLNNGPSGGGSTSIQLNASHESRIMVAAGGGRAGHAYSGGDAGGLFSSAAYGYVEATISPGANQANGYSFVNGQPGRDAKKAGDLCEEGGGGAGGGYFDGYSFQGTKQYSNAPGSGGSSYISGHEGCAKMDDFVFYKTSMISGDSLMKSYSNNGTKMTGNSDDGYAIITRVYFTKFYRKRYSKINLLP